MPGTTNARSRLPNTGIACTRLPGRSHIPNALSSDTQIAGHAWKYKFGNILPWSSPGSHEDFGKPSVPHTQQLMFLLGSLGDRQELSQLN